MNTFDLVGTSAPRPLPKWLPQIGGLVAAGLVASFVCRLPLHSFSLGELIGSAVERVLEVLLANAVTVWGLCAILPRAIGLNAHRLILRTSFDALWLAPLALFIRENSAWAMVTAAVLVASIVKSFHLLHRTGVDDSEESLVLALRRNPFSLTTSSPCFRRQASGAGAALCAQTGALAAFAGYPFTAALLVGVSSAVWTWSFTKDSPSDSRPYFFPSQSSSRALLIVALAIVFTAAGLIRFLPHSYGIRGFGIPSRYHARQRFPQGDRRGEPAREKASEGSIVPASQGDPGIILLPKKPTFTKLVAPVPAIGNGLLTNHRNADPLVIPFGGVYWFFKAPDVHPPRTSREAQGSPEVLDIRSTDRRPLSMEAHENFGSLINMDCCSRIQIAIRNADRYPETVSMELVLINTSLRGKPSQSLGRIMVKSTRPWTLYEERPPASETLNFVIPAHASIRRFDEVMVVFRLDAARADAGPKIAIDRFVLVPRGL